MIQSLIIAITSITALMMGWLIVQLLWKKTFREYISDEDVLAERRSCKNCGCTEACENKREFLKIE
ncbi:MAG: hypothetical protein IPK35_08950 [Saprospiraceae bacterium]|jgi:hypothetical protein|nr:hypothetical protein [Saprospiraceae bacterium]